MSSETESNQRELQTGESWLGSPHVEGCQQYPILQGVYLCPCMGAENKPQFF